MTPRRRLILFLGGVAALFGAAALLLPHDPAGLVALAGDGGPVTVLVLLGAWTALTPALFPGTVLAAATGLALGAVAGFPVALAGATAGGLVAFALARRGGAASVRELEGARLRRLRERIERRSFTTILLARLAPGVPATALHYVAGLARVSPVAFGAAIALGGAPRIAAYTALGGAMTDPTSPAFLAAAGALAAMGVVPAAIAWRRRAAARPAW